MCLSLLLTLTPSPFSLSSTREGFGLKGGITTPRNNKNAQIAVMNVTIATRYKSFSTCWHDDVRLSYTCTCQKMIIAYFFLCCWAVKDVVDPPHLGEYCAECKCVAKS